MADHIQIGDVSPRIQYTGDGAQTVFTYPFPIFADADLTVYEDTTLKALTTDYTVSGAGDSSGGSVTFVTAPLSSVTVTLKRQLAIQRTSDFQESGEFRSKVINDELDYLTAALQQVDDDVSRSLRLSDTDTATSLVLPDKTARSNMYLGFDSGGDPIATDATGPQGPTGPAGNMDGSNNLSELTVPATARSNLGLGTAATKNTGTANGDVVLLDATGLPAVDGSQLTGVATGATDAQRTNIALNAFRIAVNGGLSVQNMVDGVVDEFEDETGIDTGTSTNEVYSATNDLYLNGLVYGTYREASYGGGRNFGDGAAGKKSIALRFPASDAGTVSSIKVDVILVTTSFNAVAAVYSDNSGSPSSIVGSSSDATDLNSVAEKTFTWTSGAPALSAGTTYWLVITDDDAGSGLVDVQTVADQGSVYGSGRDDTITAITDEEPGIDLKAEILITAIADMTLVSNTATALATPTDAFIVLWQEDVDAVTLNTDLTAEVSRDGGTTWTVITLTEEATLSNGRILTGSVDISGQPSGTSMEYRIKTLNTKEQRLHGVSLEWS